MKQEVRDCWTGDGSADSHQGTGVFAFSENANPKCLRQSYTWTDFGTSVKTRNFLKFQNAQIREGKKKTTTAGYTNQGSIP